ncbi:MAG TPA: class I mannose-6-phosphate isomerase [Bryobacteraceae bacterium]|nr:class I mannose-6-phosphate isomerase [Bryobacteraceae bacterium]
MERLPSRFLHKIWGSEVWFEGGAVPPILVKFISTFDRLSVQVHPDDDYARLHHNCLGKTEMWHILSAKPDAEIAAGFRQPISSERLRQAALSGEIVDLLQWHKAAPGDTFFIPAGTVHAIGEGIALCEIQQSSDMTYRLYDWNRRPPLHFEHALAVSLREPHAARRDFVTCDYFTAHRRKVNDSARLEPLQLAVILDGEGTLDGRKVRAGEVWHAGPRAIPVKAAGNFTALCVCVG